MPPRNRRDAQRAAGAAERLAQRAVAVPAAQALSRSTGEHRRGRLPVHPRTACSSRAGDDVVLVSRDAGRGRARRSTGVEHALPTSGTDGDDVDVDGARLVGGLRGAAAVPRRRRGRSRRDRCVAPMPGTVTAVRRGGGRHGRRGPAAALAGGDEDGAHRHRARPTACSPNCDVVAGAAGRSRRGAARVESTRRRAMTDLDFIESEERRRCARPSPSWPPTTAGVLPGEGPRRRAHRRTVGRGGQTRLPRREPARGVRRRRRRHVRAVAGHGGDGAPPAARC